MKALIQQVLGTYTPSDPTSIAGADWEFIFGGILFAIVLYCLLRMIGAMFK